MMWCWVVTGWSSLVLSLSISSSKNFTLLLKMVPQLFCQLAHQVLNQWKWIPLSFANYWTKELLAISFNCSPYNYLIMTIHSWILILKIYCNNMGMYLLNPLTCHQQETVITEFL
jgi:hypothetical protein